jgi:ATP-dependent helicase HrpB
VVTAEKIEGSRKSDPKRWELPAWQGWHVQFQRASRVVDVR